MLVIGEGLCLKAPKVQKHTERMKIQGWEFIAQFANKNKKDGENKDSFKPRKIEPISRYMDDVIAGRPVFGEPNYKFYQFLYLLNYSLLKNQYYFILIFLKNYTKLKK